MGAPAPVIGVLGGSGVYEIDGLTNTRWEKVESSFGEPSDELLFGELNGQQLVFLPRHGRGHRISPAEVNYRANIDALKRAGVTEILSVSACGSLKEELPPGTFVIADQFIDRTIMRHKSFFGTGLVAHVALGHPTCSRLGDAVEQSLKELDIPHQRGDGGASILHDGGEQPIPFLGLRRDRHDQHAGSQVSPRSRDVLLHGRHGYRLRLLAPGPRPCNGRRHYRRLARQRG